MRKPDALRGKIVKAAKPAAFLDFIMALPDLLESLIRQNRRREVPVQIHLPQPLRIQPGNLIVAFPQALQLFIGHVLQPRKEPLRPRQKYGQIMPWQRIRVRFHLLGRRYDDAHFTLLPPDTRGSPTRWYPA